MFLIAQAVGIYWRAGAESKRGLTGNQSVIKRVGLEVGQARALHHHLILDVTTEPH